jgi:signal-transduction protein with cAMP-binding, CBS, and nucleotidyltransferase domain
MTDLNIVEKVIALEGVELFQSLTPDQLSRIAAIAAVESRPPGARIIAPDQPLEALFVVLDGAVELSRDGRVIHTAGQNEVLGAWALFDDAPMALTAMTVEHTTLLRIGREDFHDLLSDNVEIMATVFSTLVKRFRKLIEQ